MNNSDEQQPMLIPPAPAPETVDSVADALEGEIISIRAMVFRIVIGLIIFTLGVNVFIWRQTMIVRTQLADQRRQIDEYQKAEPAVRDLLQRLKAFAAAHPDFQPIIAKYAIPTNAAAPRK